LEFSRRLRRVPQTNDSRLRSITATASRRTSTTIAMKSNHRPRGGTRHVRSVRAATVVSTGVIQWLMNTAGPAQLAPLRITTCAPAADTSAPRKALEPVHVQFSLRRFLHRGGDSTYADLAGYRVTAEVYNFDRTQMYARTVPVDIPGDSSTRVLYLPNIPGLSTTYF